MADRGGGTNRYADTEARDTLEQWALSVPAPGPSLRSTSSASSVSSNGLFFCDILADIGTISGLEKSRRASKLPDLDDGTSWEASREYAS